MVSRTAAAVLAASLSVGMAACTAAVPISPRPASPSASVPAGTVPPSDVPSTPATASATTDADELGERVEIGSIDPSLTNPVLEFVSDGEAIVFSSGRAPDTAPDATPDLWRISVPSGEPDLLWRNPERNHSIVRIVADLGSVAFVDMPVTGERAWNLWLLPRGATTAVLLDTHPGHADVSSLVPSMALWGDTLVWTAFDRGTDGPVSQLRVAHAPDWEPRTLRELPAAEAEVWLPSLYGSTLAYVEVHYRDERTSDERFVFVTDTTLDAEPRRLDASGRATMPVVVDGAVLWKEADPGFSMFNWGRMYHHDLATGTTRRLRLAPQQFVNYPSAGNRYAAWWGADSFQLGVYDLVLDEPQLLVRRPTASHESALRPHIAGDLLVWMHVDVEADGEHGELHYAFLPGVRDP